MYFLTDITFEYDFLDLKNLKMLNIVYFKSFDIKVLKEKITQTLYITHQRHIQ